MLLPCKKLGFEIFIYFLCRLKDLNIALFRWYDKHLELCSFENDAIDRISIVLLTNDKLNQANAQCDGIETYTGK